MSKDELPYEVGYRKPPQRGRFTKGQSGNPKGRPKGSKNFATVVLREARQSVRVNHLYSEHWLVAYEAYVQGWLPSVDGSDYIAADPFFSLLANNTVTFYNAEEPWEDGYSDYSDDDYEEDYGDEEEDDEEE